MLQLQEFEKKSSTNFIRNVRPRLQRLFPDLYKGKDGNQRLLRDVRFLKIACSGNIPQETENDKEKLKELIYQGKNKVIKDTGMPEETNNFLLQVEQEMERLERFDDSDTEETVVNKSTVQVSADKHSYVKDNSSYNYASQTNQPAANRSFQPATTYLNMAVAPTTGLIYPPTHPVQPNLYFDMESPQFMQPYHYPYHMYSSPQYLSFFPSTVTASNSHPQLTSTSTTATPYPQSECKSTCTGSTSTKEPPSTQATGAEQKSTLLDLAEVALQI